MARLRLVDRVKSWFGAKVETSSDSARPTDRRRSLETAVSGIRMSGSGSASARVLGPETDGAGDDFSRDFDRRGHSAAAEADALGALRASPTADLSVRAALAGHAGAPGVGASSASADDARGADPVDPTWMAAMDELPQRIAEAAAHGAAGAQSLKTLAYELDGHRHNARAMLETLRRLPQIGAEQTDAALAANKLLERQLLILESMFDGITALRASFRTVDEASRRQILALSQLETCHRNVLMEYQTLLVRAHRRIAWIAAAGVVLGAAALGFAAYVALRVLVP
jgi:hypothetical protein